MTESVGGRRASIVVVSETALIGIAIGAVMGFGWWLLAPTEQWIVVDGSLFPSDVGYRAWFGADGWFLVLGAVAGLVLTALSWRRGRAHPVALVIGVIIGASLIAASAWSLGGLLGAPDPEPLAAAAENGTTLPGALGVRAVGVLFAPLLSALALLVMFIAGARVNDPAPALPVDVEADRVPREAW